VNIEILKGIRRIMDTKKVKEFPFIIDQLEEALEEREYSDRRNSKVETKIEVERRKQDRRKDSA
jgi:hypothetical protein